MTYDEAISFIHSAKMSAGSPGLGRMRALMAALGDPQEKLRFVHVAGTNGKGSTCAMLDSILRAAGYRTGLFTSPYLHRFNERMRADGEAVSDAELTELCAAVKPAAEALGGGFTEFELDTALGFLFFARHKCRIVVLEVGLGGRLDPTNVIPCPECAVITNIGLDHTAILGDTVEKIAAEKAGIIKPGCAVALYQPEDESVVSVVAAVCRERGASLRVADFDELELLGDGLVGQDFAYCEGEPLFLRLLGEHQLKNAAVVLEAVEILRERGWKLPDEAVEEGFAAAVWPARFEIVAEAPYFVVDGGHNPQCAAAVAASLRYYFPDRKRVLLLGIMADKNVDGFLENIVPAGDAFVCVRPDSPRALPAAELAAKLEKYEKPVFVCGGIPEGVRTAVGAAGKDGMVCAVGSLYMAGDVRAYFGLE